MQNKTHKAEKIIFHFGAEPPAISIETDKGEGIWIEMKDDLQVIALMENTSVHINKRLRTLLARDRNG